MKKIKLNKRQNKWISDLNSVYPGIEYDLEEEGIVIYSDLFSKNFVEDARLPEIPVKIIRVEGSLDFEGARFLKSLKNFPDSVSSYVDLKGCKNLETLEGGPKKIGGWFRLENCNSLENLDGMPEELNEDLEFIVINCPRLPQWIIDLIGERNSKKITHKELVETYYKLRQKPKLVQAKNLGLF